jgi:starch-binding outer membrane protein, SusD/RagB family
MKKDKYANKYLIVIILFIVTLFGCKKDFLVENPKSFLAPENTFVSTKGFEAALSGLYYSVREELGQPESAEIHGTFFAGTDLALIGLAQANHLPAETYGVSISSEWIVVKGAWNWAYKLIGNANQILDYTDKEGIVWDQPTDRNRIEAEARFLRSYAYRNLTMLFGDVPLVTELGKPFKLDYTRQPLSEVINFMIDDFKFAAENLPETTATDGKLVKAAAQHMLAEIYLFAGKPDLAEQQAKLVTQSTKYQLMTTRFGNYTSEPGDVFSDLFKENNTNRSSGNLESIWVVQFQYNVIGGDEGRDFSRRNWVPYYSKISGLLLCDSLGGRGVGRLRPIQWWFDSYEAKDIRNSKYNIRRHYFYNDPKNSKYGKEVAMTDALATAGTLYPSTTKFNFAKTADDPSYTDSYKDRCKIRLADTYLLLAEAQMKQGKLTEAAASINAVRSRANATPVEAKNVNMDYILDERARELFGEELRRLTLVRTGTLLDRVRRLNPKSGLTIQDFNVLWPIPQSALDGNMDAVLKQNPGYN